MRFLFYDIQLVKLKKSMRPRKQTARTFIIWIIKCYEKKKLIKHSKIIKKI